MGYVILINGSPREKSCTNQALSIVEEELNKEGINTKKYWVGKDAVQGCIACKACYKLGHCIYYDEVNEINASIDEIEGLIVGSPVYYSAPSGQILSFLDRLFYSAKSGAYDGIPGAALVSCRRSGGTEALSALNTFFTINSMPLVSSSYWNVVHGNSPEELLKDEEGVETLRTLGRNFSWLVKIIRLGKEKGIKIPQRGKRIVTNFIR